MAKMQENPSEYEQEGELGANRSSPGKLIDFSVRRLATLCKD